MADAARNEDDIVIYHVGGEGGYGPVTAIARQFPRNVHLVVFDARSDIADLSANEKLDSNGVRITVINRGIDQAAGRPHFFINTFPLSSSLLPPSPVTADENPGYRHCRTWAENTVLDYAVPVDTLSVDQILTTGLAPVPDIISLDAQGAELRILRGARRALSDHTLAVVTEVEFFEIYDGQGLFDDQMSLLSQQGFRLVNVLNQQNWHPGPLAGTGFLTVGEALFVRFVHDFPRSEASTRRGFVNPEALNNHQLVRLAAIAFGFNLLSYCFRLLDCLRDRAPDFFKEAKHVSPFRDVFDLHQDMESRMEEYKKDHLYFQKTPMAEWRLDSARKKS